MFVLLVEGTPDLLAAFQAIKSAGVHAKEFRAVCMPAASGRLTQEDCALLKKSKARLHHQTSRCCRGLQRVGGIAHCTSTACVM